MHYVYHPDHDPKIVISEEYHSYLSHGWYDTPAKFPKSMQKIREKKENQIENHSVIRETSEQETIEKKKRGRPSK